MLLVSAGVVSAAAAVAFFAVVRGASPRGADPGRCDVTATVSVTTDAIDRPLDVLRSANASWALVAAPRPGRSDGTLRVRAVRVPDEGAPAVIATLDAPASESVSKLVETPDGPTFAIARGHALTAYTLTAQGTVRERALPRGEALTARPTGPTQLALAWRDGQLHALVREGEGAATVRTHTRDVHESAPWTPRRADTFAAPALAVTDDSVLVAQEHTARAFDRSPAHTAIELVVIDASPAHPDTRATLTLTRERAEGRSPRVARLAPSGAVVVWRDAQGLAASMVSGGAQGWRAELPVRVFDGADVTGPHDVGSVDGECPAVVAWRSGDSLVARAFDPAQARVGASVRVELSPPSPAARVRLARVGARTLLAAEGRDGVRVFSLEPAAPCALTARPVVLPARANDRALRLAGFASTPTRAVLALTDAAPDASASTVRFVSFAPDATAAPAMAPAETAVQQGVSELTMFAGDVPVIVGRARNSVMLLRVGDTSEDGEPGEDLLLRAMQGAELAIASNIERHRVWVADITRDDDVEFGPAHSVVVHSAIDTLEDGPRTETRPDTVPFAGFARSTLDALADGSWGATWSRGAGECLPGVWASRRDLRDVALAPAAHTDPRWPAALALVPDAQRTCDDRALSAFWRGTTLSAVVTGPRAGTTVSVADLAQGTVRTAPLDRDPVQLASLAVHGRGTLAVWLAGTARSPSLRVRMLSAEGTPRTETVTLGEVAEAPTDGAPDDTLPLSGRGGTFATVFRTVHGPRLARLACGPVP